VFFRDGNTITGSFLVNKHYINRFNTWEPILRYPCNDHDTYTTSDEVCRVGDKVGKLTVGLSGVNHLNQPVDAYEYTQLIKKPYRSGDKFRVEYATLWVRCEFSETPPDLPLEVLGDTYQVDHTPPRPFRKGSVGICARAPFGDKVDVRFFLDFYRKQGGVDDIILYDVGITDVDYDEAINLYPFLRRKYGSLAHDVLYLSWAMGQNWLRLDCELRMKARGVDWIFAPDFDELLFPPRFKNFGSLESYLRKFQDYEWLSVGSLMSKEKIPCNETQDEFIHRQKGLHMTEWRNSGDRGPFECTEDFYDTRICPAFRGRRKLFVRNSEHRAFGQVEIHQLWSCAYYTMSEKQFGMDLNAEFHPYIRHFRDLNNHKCNE
jgi:hypothetical protein